MSILLKPAQEPCLGSRIAMLLALRRCGAYYVTACAAVNHYFYLPPIRLALHRSAQKFPVPAGALAENFCKLPIYTMMGLAAGTLFCVDEWILAKQPQRVNKRLQIFYHVACHTCAIWRITRTNSTDLGILQHFSIVPWSIWSDRWYACCWQFSDRFSLTTLLMLYIFPLSPNATRRLTIQPHAVCFLACPRLFREWQGKSLAAFIVGFERVPPARHSLTVSFRNLLTLSQIRATL